MPTRARPPRRADRPMTLRSSRSKILTRSSRLRTTSLRPRRRTTTRAPAAAAAACSAHKAERAPVRENTRENETERGAARRAAVVPSLADPQLDFPRVLFFSRCDACQGRWPVLVLEETKERHSERRRERHSERRRERHSE